MCTVRFCFVEAPELRGRGRRENRSCLIGTIGRCGSEIKQTVRIELREPVQQERNVIKNKNKIKYTGINTFKKGK